MHNGYAYIYKHIQCTFKHECLAYTDIYDTLQYMFKAWSMYNGYAYIYKHIQCMICIHIYAYIYMHTYICIHIWAYIYMHTYIRIHVYAYIYAYIYTYHIYGYAYIYKHIQCTIKHECLVYTDIYRTCKYLFTALFMYNADIIYGYYVHCICWYMYAYLLYSFVHV